MVTPSPPGFEAFVFLPVAAQKQQEQLIRALQKKTADLEHNATHTHSNSGQLEGKGEQGSGGGLGVPPDFPKKMEESVVSDIKTLPNSSQSEKEEEFANKPTKGKPDPDPFMPGTMPPSRAKMLQSKPLIEPGLRLNGGSAKEESDYPWYIGMYEYK